MDRRSFLKTLAGVAGAFVGGRLVADMPEVPSRGIEPIEAALPETPPLFTTVKELSGPFPEWICSGWVGPYTESGEKSAYEYDDDGEWNDDDDY